jgi:hypothetical protein
MVQECLAGGGGVHVSSGVGHYMVIGPRRRLVALAQVRLMTPCSPSRVGESER